MPHNIKQKNHFFPLLKKFLTKLFHLLINTNNSIKNATTILEKASKKLEKKKGKGTYYNLESEVLEWIKREVREVILVI